MRQRTENQHEEEPIQQIPATSSGVDVQVTDRAASSIAVPALESPSVVDVLQQAARRLRRGRRLATGTFLAAAVFTPFAIAGIDGDLGWSGFLILFAGLALGLGRSALLQIRAVGSVHALQDMHALGPLIDAQTDADLESRTLSYGMLVRLLSQLGPRDADVLSPDQYESLIRLLPQARPELALAILKALEAIGDSRAIPAVERLAGDSGDGSPHPSVYEAANTCLAALRGRCGRITPKVKALRERPEGAAFSAVSSPARDEPSLSIDPTALVKALQDERYATRKEALKHLRRLDADTLGAVITRLVSGIRRLRIRSRVWLAMSVVAGLAVWIYWEVSVLDTSTIRSLHDQIGVFGMPLTIAAILGWPVVRIQARLRRDSALLAQVDDVRAAGPLIESLHSGDPDTLQSAESALRHLLPRLRATDTGLLSDRQKESLGRALAITGVDFVLAALKALEQIGDERSISSSPLSRLWNRSETRGRSSPCTNW